MFFFSSRRRHTRYWRDWSSDVCSSDLSYTADPNGVGPSTSFRGSPAQKAFPDPSSIRHLGREIPIAREFTHPSHISADRKSVVQGKSVDLGGRRIIKKKYFRGLSQHLT